MAKQIEEPVIDETLFTFEFSGLEDEGTPTEETPPIEDPEGDPEEPEVDPLQDDPDPDPDEPEEGYSSEEEEYMQNHFKYIQENEFLDLPEDFEFDGTNLEEAYRLSDTRRTEALSTALIQSMPAELQQVVEYGLQGGQDLSSFINKSAEVNSLDKMQEFSADDERAASFVKDVFMQDKGIAAEDADIIVTRLKDNATLSERANQLLTAKKEAYKADLAKQLEDQKQAQADKKAADIEYYQKAFDYMAAQSWPDSAKQKLKGFIYNNRPVETINHILANDSTAFVQLAAFLSSYQEGKGFTQKADKAARVQAAKTVKDSFFRAAASKRKTASAKPRKKKDPIQDMQGYDITFD